MKMIVTRRDFILESDSVRLRLLRPKGWLARAVGLLNHLTLAADEGLAFGSGLAFHTYGMRFPILVLCLNREGLLVSPPRVVEPGMVFLAPWSARWVLEASPTHFDHFWEIWGRSRKG